MFKSGPPAPPAPPAPQQRPSGHASTVRTLVPAMLLLLVFMTEARHRVKQPSVDAGDAGAQLPGSLAAGQHHTRELQAVSAADALQTNGGESSRQATVDGSGNGVSRGAARRLKLGKRGNGCMGQDGQASSFIMIFMGHSGSSAVMSELAAHSRVKIDVPEAVDHDEMATNSTAALAFTRSFFRRAIENGRVPGYKMRPRHIRADPEGWAALAREFGTRIIWNYRANIVKQAVGEYSFKKLKDPSVVEGLKSESEVRERCRKGVGCQFRIDDMKFFHHTLTDVAHGANVVSHAVHLVSFRGAATPAERLCVHELQYEDYLYDRAGTMRDLLGFLGLGFEDTRPNRFKATKDNMCEVVENWEEVCRNFYGCQVWRGMMDDDHNGCSCNQGGGEINFCETRYNG